VLLVRFASALFSRIESKRKETGAGLTNLMHQQGGRAGPGSNTMPIFFNMPKPKPGGVSNQAEVCLRAGQPLLFDDRTKTTQMAVFWPTMPPLLLLASIYVHTKAATEGINATILICLWHSCNSLAEGPLGAKKSPDGDTTNGICGTIGRKMKIAGINTIDYTDATCHICSENFCRLSETTGCFCPERRIP